MEGLDLSPDGAAAALTGMGEGKGQPLLPTPHAGGGGGGGGLPAGSTSSSTTGKGGRVAVKRQPPSASAASVAFTASPGKRPRRRTPGERMAALEAELSKLRRANDRLADQLSLARQQRQEAVRVAAAVRSLSLCLRVLPYFPPCHIFLKSFLTGVC